MRRALLALLSLATTFCMPVGKANADIFYRPTTQGVRVGTDADYVYTEYYGFDVLDISDNTYTPFLPEFDATLKSPFEANVNTNGNTKDVTRINNFQDPLIGDGKLIWYGQQKDDAGKFNSFKFSFDPTNNEWSADPIESLGTGTAYYTSITELLNNGSDSGGGSSDFSELTINGVSVQEQIDDNSNGIDSNRANINNLGDGIAASTALSAALSALPVAATNAPFSCGVGTGGYSSRFAMSLGCAAKLNQRLSLNAGGSHVFGGSSDYGGGSLDTVAWRGGFVFKLGKLDSSAATNEQLQSQLNDVKQENTAIKAKYSTIEEQNKDLMARLQRLEAIALGQQTATTTASLK